MMRNETLRHTAISLLASAIATLLWAASWYQPRLQQTRELQSQLQLLRTNASHPPLSPSLTALQNQIDTTRAQLQRTRERYPSVLSSAALVRELETLARNHQLTVLALTLHHDLTTGPIHSWSVDLRLLGRYPNLLDFSAALEDTGRAQALSSLMLQLVADNLELQLRYHAHALAGPSHQDAP